MAEVSTIIQHAWKFDRKKMAKRYLPVVFFCILVIVVWILIVHIRKGTETPITKPSYIVGLAYYELGDKNVIINVPGTIPQNTALVITLYEAYQTRFSQRYDANVNIVGLGKNHVKTIIWATYENVLHFTTDATTKRLSYAGYKNISVNQVAQKEFGRDADLILSAYRSPQNINIASVGTETPITKPSYIVGLAYYELGDKNVIINVPGTIPQNTALVITLYEAYHPGFRQQYAANVNIVGLGKIHVKTIIWATYENVLHFTTDATTKRLSYAGYKRSSVNQVAQKEFGRDADVILSAYRSPQNINIASVGTETPITKPSYIVGLAYYELGDKTVIINVPGTIPQNTALVITLYEAYQTRFSQQYDANVNIVGVGKNHVKTIIWATYENVLHFTTDATTKRLSYAGYKDISVNQVAQKEFGRNADLILSAYRSPQNINIASVGTEAPITKPSYIVGLAYYELGDKNVIINVPGTIPQNTALVITLYEAYQTRFSQQYDANVNIVGLGKSHVKTIIWATLENTLHFTTDARTKRLPYAGYKKSSVNQVAQKEFGRNADVILSAYRSPKNINIVSVGTETPITKPSYIVGLAYYELGDKNVIINVPGTIPQNTALVITLYEAYQTRFSQRYDANVNIVGLGKNHVKTIIWATFKNVLHFTTDATTKRLSYAGYKRSSVNQVAQKEFGRDADVILSAYRSPQIINIVSVGTEAPITKPSYIVGLAYYELGDKTVIINVPGTFPQNTALVITLYEAYHPGFRQQYDANVNIVGLGKNHVKTIIWATYENVLHFTTDATTKRLSYAGYKNISVNQVAQKEFGRDADLILSAYRSPQNINIASVGTEAPITKPSYIVGLAYYELGDKNVTINVPVTIPQNTALVITLYEAYHPWFRQQYDANVKIVGLGKSHVKTIIWATYENVLHFTTDATTKRLSYAGYKRSSVNKVVQKEFGRNADVILSAYRSPVNMDVPERKT